MEKLPIDFCCAKDADCETNNCDKSREYKFCKEGRKGVCKPVTETDTTTQSPTDGTTQSQTDGTTQSQTDATTQSPTNGTTQTSDDKDDDDNEDGEPRPSTTVTPIIPDISRLRQKWTSFTSWGF